MEEIIDKLIEFAKREAMVSKRAKVDLESRLYEDLELTGDDALEFIVAYSKSFNVDVSRFMAADYFAGEGMNWFTGNDGKKSITLRNLLNGIKYSKLDEDVINLK